MVGYLFFMHPVYSCINLKTEIICCSSCSWQGAGTEASIEYLFLTKATELYCPECNQYLGIADSNEERS